MAACPQSLDTPKRRQLISRPCKEGGMHAPSGLARGGLSLVSSRLHRRHLQPVHHQHSQPSTAFVLNSPPLSANHRAAQGLQQQSIQAGPSEQAACDPKEGLKLCLPHNKLRSCRRSLTCPPPRAPPWLLPQPPLPAPASTRTGSAGSARSSGSSDSWAQAASEARQRHQHCLPAS